MGYIIFTIFFDFLFFLKIFQISFLLSYNRLGGVMVSVFNSSVVDRGFEYRSGQTTMQMVFVVSPLSTLRYGERGILVGSESG